MAKITDETYYPLRDRLLAAYPGAFGTLKDPRPLKIGIFEDLMAQPDADPQTRKFLARWTNRHEYRAALSRGGPRFGLDGQPNGTITPDQSDFAIERITARIFRRINSRDAQGKAMGYAELNADHTAPFRERVVSQARALAQTRAPRRYAKFWPFRESA